MLPSRLPNSEYAPPLKSSMGSACTSSSPLRPERWLGWGARTSDLRRPPRATCAAAAHERRPPAPSKVVMRAKRADFGRLMRAGEPLVPELAHRVDDREERLALLRQLVLDARRRLGIAVPLDDPFVLERAQALRQRPRRDTGARVLELREAARPFREVVDEEGRPLRTDDLGTRCDCTRGRLVDRVHRPHGYPNCSEARRRAGSCG